MSDQGGNSVKGFFGALLIAVGALMAGLCGLCTLVVAIGGLVTGGNGGGDEIFSGGDTVILALVIGGVPTAIGVGLFFIGNALWRQAKAPTAAGGDAP